MYSGNRLRVTPDPTYDYSYAASLLKDGYESMTLAWSEFDCNAFFAKVAMARRRVLMLDYDGTLAPFREMRDQAIPYDGVRALLNALIKAKRTRLVIVTGRSIYDLIPLLGLEARPEIWGSHGWEQLSCDGDYSVADPDPQATALLTRARYLIDQYALIERLEHKPVSLAIHWRGLSPDITCIIEEKVMGLWSPLTWDSNLEIHPFDGGLELRVKGTNKGVAVRRILGNTNSLLVAAYLGDDLTDEDAFEAVHGIGLGVLVRPVMRSTKADVWIRPPQELLTFLRGWHQAELSN